MNSKRQATPSAKGYILQGYFGIYFFFKDKNYKEIDWIKIEAPKEDIEIQYYDGSKDFIQVKTHEKPFQNTKFDISAFKKGISTLYEALEKSLSENINVNRLILANNMLNQGIERLTSKIKDGKEENFIYNFQENFSNEELESFFKKVKNNLKEILYLARVDDSYLINTSKVLPELKKIINELELQNIENNINESLKVLFNENSCNRVLIINKKQVAWAFIKYEKTPNKIYDKFNKDFEKEIADANIIEIEFLIDEFKIKNMLENYSNNYEIYTFFQKMLQEYIIKLGNIDAKNLKNIMNKIAEEILKKGYLYLSDNYSEKEKLLICCFFTYFLFFNSKKLKSIYDEFNIKEKENETN